ncbi:hypothetical protein [Actinoplanes sp. NPDC048796]|uniref:hypothetical protein n=1 Tax=Actinoplanes sp. NPDC048796 TaxID=3155640 RepID=UPI0033D243D0
MSSIIKFFVAPDDEVAAGAAEEGPGARFEPITYGNFDVWSTLEELESILTGRDLEEVLDQGGPEIISGAGEPMLLRVPTVLVEALSTADSETISGAAEQWLSLRAGEGEALDEELAHEIVSELAATAARAQRTTQSLYCWVA